MKIKVILPIIDVESHTFELRKKQLHEIAAPDTELEIVTLDKGTTSIESAYDDTFIAPDLLRKVKEAGDSGFDAIVIHCAIDPVLDAARELVKIPVVGIGQASILLALTIGEYFSIISLKTVEKPFIHLTRKLGVESQLASIRLMDVEHSELHIDREKTKQEFIKQARKAMEEDKAEVIIPGCGFFTTMTQELQEELGAPVINPGGAGVAMAEVLVRLNLAHSKKAYPQPPPNKKRTL